MATKFSLQRVERYKSGYKDQDTLEFNSLASARKYLEVSYNGDLKLYEGKILSSTIDENRDSAHIETSAVGSPTIHWKIVKR